MVPGEGAGEQPGGGDLSVLQFSIASKREDCKE